MWNSLPDEVVNVESLDVFKNRLDKYWRNQEVRYDWKAELSDTGSRSIKFSN